MEQKKRDRLAWIAAIVLAPILIYLLATNVFKAGKQTSPPAPPAPTESAGGLNPGTPPLSVPAPPALIAIAPPLDPQSAAEQRKIADHLPRRNPFSAIPETSVAPAPASQPASVAGPASSSDSALKVTAIMSRPGSKRMAMINGRLLGEGARIGEWTILKVNAQNVLLDNGSRQVVVGAK